MPLTYTYDETLPAALDRMRLALGDTVVSPTSSALLPNETYLAMLSLAGETLATASLAESLAAQYAQQPDSVGSDGESFTWKDRVKTWLELATRLRAVAATAASAAARRGAPAVSVMTTNAPVMSPTGYPDANSGAYRGDPNNRTSRSW